MRWQGRPGTASAHSRPVSGRLARRHVAADRDRTGRCRTVGGGLRLAVGADRSGDSPRRGAGLDRRLRRAQFGPHHPGTLMVASTEPGPVR